MSENTSNTEDTNTQRTTTKRKCGITIGFLHHYGLGDNLCALKSLYLAKKAYNAKIIIFGNGIFKQILSYCRFLDSTDLVVDISHLCEHSLPIVACHKCDYFILTNPKSHYIRLLSALHTPIITPLKFPSLFSAKAKCPPLAFFPLYSKLRADNALCALVRLIDKKAFDSFCANLIDSVRNPLDLTQTGLADFDSNFASKDLANARLARAKSSTKSLAGGGKHYKQKSRHISWLNFAPKMAQLDFALKDEIKLQVPNPKIAQSFLRQCVKNYKKDLQNKTLETPIDSCLFRDSKIDFTKADSTKSSTNSTKNPTLANLTSAKSCPPNPTFANTSPQLPQPFIICINPFSNAATHTLPLEAFCELISRILALPNCCVLVITFPSVHNEFVAKVSSHHSLQSQKSKLFIYPNDNTLSNLIALLGFQSLLISPSTGTIHLASNLGIKTIGLYSSKDTTRWATRDNLYTIIPTQKSRLTQKQISNIIDKTIYKIQRLIDSNALKPFESLDLDFTKI